MPLYSKIALIVTFIVSSYGHATFRTIVAKNWGMSDVWAKKVTCNDYLSSSPELVNLQKAVQTYRSHLLELEKISSKIGNVATQDRLCYPVCGIVTSALKEHLTSQGYSVTQFITKKLGDNYTSPDHTFLVIHLEGGEVIVDAAYLSFLAMVETGFNTEVARVLFGDILILPYSRLDEWVLENVELREKYYRFVQERDELHGRRTDINGSRLSRGMNRQQFTNYLRKIWDFKDSIYSVN